MVNENVVFSFVNKLINIYYRTTKWKTTLAGQVPPPEAFHLIEKWFGTKESNETRNFAKSLPFRFIIVLLFFAFLFSSSICCFDGQIKTVDDFSAFLLSKICCSPNQ